MFTSSLINMTILAYFSVSSGHGLGVDLHAGQKPAAKVVGKVVLREDSLSEKLGLETAVRPDAEIAALRIDARSIPAALDLGDRAKKLTSEKAPEYRIAAMWDKHVDRFLHKEEDDAYESHCTDGLIW
jgi:hypothetical protein